MKPPTKSARKAPARKPAPPSEADQIRALLGRSTPSEQRAIIAVMERTNAVMAETNKIVAQIAETNKELTRVLQLKRGLLSLQACSETR